jgi:hypothetical protein
MKDAARKVLLGIAPVAGTLLSIAALKGAGVPFPPALSSEALLQWLIFAVVTYGCVALCFALVDRICKEF